MKKWKDKCEILKKIRKYVAKKYGLDYKPSECTHEGSCMGSCLKCDEELYALQKQLEKKGIDSIASDKTLQKLVEEFADKSIEEVHDSGIVGMMFTALSEKPSGNGHPRPALNRVSEPMSR